MRRIDYIVIHCSATPEGRHVTVEEIDRWHRQRGFRKIGYHKVIYLDGTVHVGREEEEIGAHVKGYNKNSIGVCYIGGVDKNMKTKDTRTEAQKYAMKQLLIDLKLKHPKAIIKGHRDFPNVKKDCPSLNAKEEYKNL